MSAMIRSITLALLVALGVATALPAAAQQFSKEQLEQIVAPIALYPDSLLTQILMASTYPLEVVEAQRWIGQNKGLKGTALDNALKEKSWDPSVKGLCTVPDVLTKMSENLDWTQDLGDAFLSQKQQLLDTVQVMRNKAYEAGNLKTTKQQVVKKEPDQIIVIESAAPEVIYVPSYSPTVVYGAWSYPTYYYPPMYAPPPPGYGLLTFGVGMAVGAAIWGDCDWGWGHGDVDIDIDHYNNFNRNTNVNWNKNEFSNNRVGNTNRARWEHNPAHRKGVNYRDQGVARQYGAASGSNRVSREQARGWSQGASNRAAGGAQQRDRTGAADRAQAGNRAQATDRAQTRQGAGARTERSGAQATQRSGGRETAYSGARSPQRDRAASTRGSASRGSPSFSGHSGGGRAAGGGRAGGGGGRRR